MSDQNKEVRDSETIRKEYTALCIRAGHAHYQIKALEKDLELIYKSMRDLDLELVQVSNKEAEATNESKS